jgi:Flp pilus assembly protein CpaB
MTYRIRNIVIAVGLALMAMLLTLLYVTNYRKSVQHNAQTVRVYVAARDVAAGTSGVDVLSQNDLKAENVQRHDAVPGAISSLNTIQSLVLLDPLYAGEQVTLRHFGSAAQEGIAGQLKGALRAVQVAGDPNQLLAGTLQTGDHVDVVANLHPSGGGATSNTSRIVLRDILVLSASSSAASSKLSASSNGSDSVILEVSDTQVQRLFYVMKNSDWTLELRPAVGASDSAEHVETADTMLTRGVK